MTQVITLINQINQLNFDLLESKNRTSTVRKYQKRLKDYRSELDQLQGLNDEEKGRDCSTSYGMEVSLKGR